MNMTLDIMLKRKRPWFEMGYIKPRPFDLLLYKINSLISQAY